MKLHTRIITYSLLFVLLAMTFFSCSTDKTSASGTASTDGTDTVTENADKEPFVPYTLKHTTIDLSDQLPRNIPKEFNSLGVTSYPEQPNDSVKTLFLSSCAATLETCLIARSLPQKRPSQSMPGISSYS